MVRSAPRDLASLRGFAAAAGLPRMAGDYRVLPPEVERRFRLPDHSQIKSKARRYIS